MIDEDNRYLSAGEQVRIRRRYYLFSILNGVSFRLLAGNIITLFALRLGAGNTYVGMLSSFIYLAMLFLPAGRPLIKRLGAVRLQATFWAMRYLLMLPVLLTILPQIRSLPIFALAILGFAVFGFHTSKGIAMAGQKTILGLVAGEKDRGVVLSRIQSYNTLFSTAAWLLIGIALGREAPFGVYAAVFAAGIVVGLGGAWTLSGIPEPREAEAGSSVPLLPAIRRGFENPGFRRLTALVFLKYLLVAMSGAFLVVQFKRVFLHTDSDVVYITLLGNMGIVAMAALTGFLIDKVGAKPLFFAFSVMTALSLLLLSAGPAPTNGLLVWIIPCAVIFFYQMGASGMANCSQNYFFATVSPEERVNLGISFSLTVGIAGFIGSVSGGLILDLLLAHSGLTEIRVFRIYFGTLVTAYLALSLLVRRLPDIGAYSIRDIVSILFSPRNLRVIRLLRRLDRSRSADEEQRAIRALGTSPSAVSTDDLVQKLRSPSFTVRSEALNALRNHPIGPRIRDALIYEIVHHQYTTAYVAAEIIGRRDIGAGIPALRSALSSEDFMLCGKAMVSLAQLNDGESLPAMLRIFRQTANPRLIIHAARAFGYFRDPDLIPVLLTKLAPQIAPFVRDEIILSIAEITGMGRWFYPLYTQFIEQPLNAARELRSRYDGEFPLLDRLCMEAAEEPEKFAGTAARIIPDAGISIDGKTISEFFSEALGNGAIVRLSRFRFLLAALCVREVLRAG